MTLCYYILALKSKGTEAEWFEKAEQISNKLKAFDGKGGWKDYVVPDNKPWLQEAGDKILDIGYPDWRGLYNQPNPVTGSNASSWDKRFLTKEQTSLQPIHEKYIEPLGWSEFLLDLGVQRSDIVKDGSGKDGTQPWQRWNTTIDKFFKPSR